MLSEMKPETVTEAMLATVGRTAAGRALDERAITAAAIAAIRHTHTRYDELLMSGFERVDARDAVREVVHRVLNSWREPA
jgi:hypothetical protein